LLYTLDIEETNRLGDFGMYEVKKISTTAYNSDGSPVYEYSFEYGTWDELRRDIARREKYANEVFTGYGAAVFKDGEKIGELRDFWLAGGEETPTSKVTLKAFTNEAQDFGSMSW